ncbi:MAG: hypothetical protein RLZZ123_214 [Pseudomonadota bacterium]|jgi:acyl-CoA dehydrogenase
MENLFSIALGELLKDRCSAAEVRHIEATPGERGLWQALEESGFANALLPEEAEGAALPLAQAFELWELCGRYALPLPLPETQWARALLHASGVQSVPAGPIGLGLGWRPDPCEQSHIAEVSAGRGCDHVLIGGPEGLRLLPVAQARIQPHGLALDARMGWRDSDWAATPLWPYPTDLTLAQALLAAAQLSGAMMAVFEQTLDYANQRQQFGKPIGKFQAIQHNLSLLAEEVFAARMAVQMACEGQGARLSTQRIAVAKARTSLAAQKVTALAHGLHGAIGFTHEFDLQLRTRRLHAWRLCAGAESHWQQRLGADLLARHDQTLDFLRELTDH